jgi:hypothetical protein
MLVRGISQSREASWTWIFNRCIREVSNYLQEVKRREEGELVSEKSKMKKSKK